MNGSLFLKTITSKNKAGRLIRIGNTMDGRNVCVVFEWIEVDWCVLPITGYDVGKQ